MGLLDQIIANLRANPLTGEPDANPGLVSLSKIINSVKSSSAADTATPADEARAALAGSPGGPTSEDQQVASLVGNINGATNTIQNSQPPITANAQPNVNAAGVAGLPGSPSGPAAPINFPTTVQRAGDENSSLALNPDQQPENSSIATAPVAPQAPEPVKVPDMSLSFWDRLINAGAALQGKDVQSAGTIEKDRNETWKMLKSKKLGDFDDDTADYISRNPATLQEVLKAKYAGNDIKQTGVDDDGFPAYGVTNATGSVTPIVTSPSTAAASGAQNAATTGLTGEDYLKTLSQPKADFLRAILQGRGMPAPTGAALRSPQTIALMHHLAQADPSFDMTKWTDRIATQKDYASSGKSGQSIGAINTAIGHLKSLGDEGEALNNSRVPIFNSIANGVLENTGDPRMDRFDANRKAVVDELTRVWRGSGGSEGDIETWSKAINSSQSPAQMRGVIAKISDLMESKLQTLDQQWTDNMGTLVPKKQTITPQARQDLDAMKARGAGNVRPQQSASAPIGQQGIPAGNYRWDATTGRLVPA